MQIRTNFQGATQPPHNDPSRPEHPSGPTQGQANFPGQQRPLVGAQKPPHPNRSTTASNLDQLTGIGPGFHTNPLAGELTTRRAPCCFPLHHQPTFQQPDAFVVGGVPRVHQERHAHRHQLQHRKGQHQSRTLRPEKPRHTHRKDAHRSVEVAQLSRGDRTVAFQRPLHALFGHGRKSESAVCLVHHPPPVLVATVLKDGALAKGRCP